MNIVMTIFKNELTHNKELSSSDYSIHKLKHSFFDLTHVSMDLKDNKIDFQLGELDSKNEFITHLYAKEAIEYYNKFVIHITKDLC